jgi:hypothetical protein
VNNRNDGLDYGNRRGNNGEKFEEGNAENCEREIAIEGEAKARRELTNGARCEVEKVESGVEELVEETHEAQHGPVGVVDVHDRVLVHIDELVGCFALQNCPENPQISEGLPANLGLHLRMKVEPMTRHIDRHR